MLWSAVVEHGIKVVKLVMERKLHNISRIDGLQFVFMHGKSTLDGIFIACSIQ